MNLERETKITFTVSYSEIVRALKAIYPEEFLLNQLPTVFTKEIKLALMGNSGLMVTYAKASQGPAEIPFNRLQREEA